LFLINASSIRRKYILYGELRGAKPKNREVKRGEAPLLYYFPLSPILSGRGGYRG